MSVTYRPARPFFITCGIIAGNPESSPQVGLFGGYFLDADFRPVFCRFPVSPLTGHAPMSKYSRDADD
jgi:hypothetical protein